MGLDLQGFGFPFGKIHLLCLSWYQKNIPSSGPQFGELHGQYTIVMHIEAELLSFGMRNLTITFFKIEWFDKHLQIKYFGMRND